jgi:hypothetical protein
MWPAEWLAGKYFEISSLPSRAVNRAAAAKLWKTDKNYASVTLHKMREALLVDRLERGTYLPVPQEKWVPVHSFLTRASEIAADLSHLLQDSMNDIEGLMLYGSRIWGGDEWSDWDFFIVASSQKSRNMMRSKLFKIKQKNSRLDAEILSIQDFVFLLRKDPIFFKLVGHECKPILDAGILGIIKTIEIKPKHIAVEMLAAKENILQGMVHMRRGENGVACYWFARGIRRTLAAMLAMRENFSGKALEEEFKTRFSQYGQLRLICRKVTAGQEISTPKGFLKDLTNRAVIEWERIAKGLPEWGKSAG